MDYEFGDILDARKAPNPLGHFLIILGETRRGDEVMYYIVTSRVYAVFKDLLTYFNDCITRNDKSFLRYFSKEKNKSVITSHGNLIDALFLDKHSCYGGCFDVDSMIVLNSDPPLIDKRVLETLRTDGKVLYKDKLSDIDLHKLISIAKHSMNISPDKANQISANFNKEKKARQLRSSR